MSRIGYRDRIGGTGLSSHLGSRAVKKLTAGLLISLAWSGLGTAQESVPPYLAELRRLTGDTSLTLEKAEASIAEASSPYNHFMNLYVTGKLPSMKDAFRLVALRSGVEPLPSALQEGAESIELFRKDPDIVVKEIAYRGSISGLHPLYAEICYDPKVRNAPIAVIQHGGNPGSRFPTVSSCYRMAQKGLFGLAVSKRARDGSAGANDSWAVETFDIIDAVEHVKRTFAAQVDATNINIWGYSGGCIDSVAAAVRFPDYFRVVAPYFCQLEWTKTFASIPKDKRGTHASEGEKAKGNNIVDGIGGFPDEVPDRYLARDLLLGVVNNPYSRFHFFLDERDPSGPLLEEHFKGYLAKSQALGYRNVQLHLSKPGDLYRWHHMYPGAWAELASPELMAAEALYVSHVIEGAHPEPVLADGGRINVLGYIKTKRFFIWLGDGANAVAELDYALSGPVMTFVFRALSSDPAVRGRLEVPNRDGRRWRIEINGKVVEQSSAPQLSADFAINDRVVLRRLN